MFIILLVYHNVCVARVHVRVGLRVLYTCMVLRRVFEGTEVFPYFRTKVSDGRFDSGLIMKVRVLYTYV